MGVRNISHYSRLIPRSFSAAARSLVGDEWVEADFLACRVRRALRQKQREGTFVNTDIRVAVTGPFCTSSQYFLLSRKTSNNFGVANSNQK